MYLSRRLRLTRDYNAQKGESRLAICFVREKVVFTCVIVVSLRLKAKFHYAVWSQTGPKLVADLQQAGIWPMI